MEIRIESLENIRETAKSFVNEIGDRRVFAFYGKMGAGKTHQYFTLTSIASKSWRKCMTWDMRTISTVVPSA